MKGGTPEPPDYGPIAAAAEKSSKRAFKLANKQFKWAKKTWKKDRKFTNSIVKDLREMMQEQADIARADRQRYEDVFLPLQDKFIEGADRFRDRASEFQDKADSFSAEVEKLKREAEKYGSEDNKRFMMGAAQADVAQQFEAARQNAMRDLEAFGINPSATRYAALDIGVRTAEAAARAAAGTKMGLDVDARSDEMYQVALDRELQARGLDAQALGFDALAQDMDLNAINIGQGFPGQVLGAYGGATGSGGTAVGGRLSTTQTGNQTRLGTVNFMNSGTNALNTWLTALDTGFNNELDAYRAGQESSSGFGSIFGGLAGLVTSFMEEGGPVEHEMSPSGGAIPDDVPARLTAGEYVIPKEVVDWYGKQHFHKLIQKARADQGIPVD